MSGFLYNEWNIVIGSVGMFVQEVCIVKITKEHLNVTESFLSMKSNGVNGSSNTHFLIVSCIKFLVTSPAKPKNSNHSFI